MISSSPRKCQENTKTKPQNGNAAKFKSHRNCDVAGSDYYLVLKNLFYALRKTKSILQDTIAIELRLQCQLYRRCPYQLRQDLDLPSQAFPQDIFEYR